MRISSKYIVVEKLEEPVKEGFKAVEVQDNFVYKGRVINIGTDLIPILEKEQVRVLEDGQIALPPKPFISIGDVILFAKYSPDTHEMDLEGKKVKFVKLDDVLAVL